MKNTFFPFGMRHEVAKRWPVWDWKKSIPVARKIDPLIADIAIHNLISSNKPGLVGRLGGTEARFLREYKKISLMPDLVKELLYLVKPNWKRRSKEVNTNAGFYYENIAEVDEFFNIYSAALSDTDILGAWGTAFSSIERDFIDKISQVIPVGMTAPWIHPYSDEMSEVPWSKALMNKRVLIVSPFANTIKIQFNRIDKVFPDLNLHNFDLEVIKSPMTINTNFPVTKSWFTNLNEVKHQMSNTNYDIAMISAGSYSYPLAHHAKSNGKIGIHAGGGLQLFFGIMGKRWDGSEFLKEILNPYWTRPSPEETPNSAHLVEGGCYW